MLCKECDHARRFNGSGIYCVFYGMILREDHRCTREGARKREYHHSEGSERETEIYENGGGTTGEVPGVLHGSGKRAGIPGMEEEQKGGGMRHEQKGILYLFERDRHAGAGNGADGDPVPAEDGMGREL